MFPRGVFSRLHEEAAWISLPKATRAGNRGIMKYLIVEVTSAGELQKQVQQYIDQGWEPTGGVSVATYGMGAWWYYQAMIWRESV